MLVTDEETLQLLQTTSLNTYTEGYVWIVQEDGKLCYYLLTLRPPFLIYQPKRVETCKLRNTSNISLTQNSHSTGVLTIMDIVVDKVTLDFHTGKDYSDASIQIYRNSRAILTFLPSDKKSDEWLNILRTTSTNKHMWYGNNSMSEGKTNTMCLSSLQKNLLANQNMIENLVDENNTLRIALNSATIAAAEHVDQKTQCISKMSGVVEQLKKELQESFDKIQVLKNDLKKSRLTLCSTEKQLAEMSTRYKNLEGYFDSNKNANSAKVALELSQKEKRIEELLKEVNDLRINARESFEHNQKLADSVEKKINIIKQAMDASDAINLVRVKHELCLFIIKILRRSRTKIMSSEEQLHIIQRVTELQRDVRLKETCAKSQYIRFRSLLLQYRLNELIGMSNDHVFINCLESVLQTFQWILQVRPLECKAIKPCGKSVTTCHGMKTFTGIPQSYNTLALTDSDEDPLLLPPSLLFPDLF